MTYKKAYLRLTDKCAVIVAVMYISCQETEVQHKHSCPAQADDDEGNPMKFPTSVICKAAYALPILLIGRLFRGK